MNRLVVAIAVCASVAVASANPRQAKIHAKQAAAYYAAGQYDEAIAEFEKQYAIVKKPQTLFNIANAYYKKSDYRRAIEYFQKYLQADPDGKYADQAMEFTALATKSLAEADKKKADEDKKNAAQLAEQQRQAQAAEEMRRTMDAERQRLVAEEAARRAAPPPAAAPESAPIATPTTTPVEGSAPAPVVRKKAVFGIQLGQHLPIYGEAFSSQTPITGSRPEQKTKPGGSAAIFVDIRTTKSSSLRLRGRFDYSDIEFEACSPCQHAGKIALFTQSADLLLRIEGFPTLVPYAGVGITNLAGHTSYATMPDDVGISGIAPNVQFGVALQFNAGMGRLSIDLSMVIASADINMQAQVDGFRQLQMLLGYAFGK